MVEARARRGVTRLGAGPRIAVVQSPLKYILVGLLAACGGSDLDPGAGNDAGGGTGTLVVDGRATAEPNLANARVASDFDTELEVRVRLNGVDVIDGSVTVTSTSGTFELALADTDSGKRWRGLAPSYDEVYILDIVSGDDAVDSVRVDGPDIHTFLEPLAGATVDATQPIAVRWSGDHQAASAAIDAEEIDELAIDDTGEFSLPGGALKTDQDKVRENTLRISRVNRVVPAGAAAGSEWSVSIRNEITVLAARSPRGRAR